MTTPRTNPPVGARLPSNGENPPVETADKVSVTAANQGVPTTSSTGDPDQRHACVDADDDTGVSARARDDVLLAGNDRGQAPGAGALSEKQCERQNDNGDAADPLQPRGRENQTCRFVRHGCERGEPRRRYAGHGLEQGIEKVDARQASSATPAQRE